MAIRESKRKNIAKLKFKTLKFTPIAVKYDYMCTEALIMDFVIEYLNITMSVT